MPCGITFVLNVVLGATIFTMYLMNTEIDSMKTLHTPYPSLPAGSGRLDVLFAYLLFALWGSGCLYIFNVHIILLYSIYYSI